jgi:predicted dehydrogenase
MNPARRNVLVVGVGSIGERHVRCFQKTGRAEISICELNPRLLDEVGQRYGIKRAYNDLSLALSETYDAAVIAVPANAHITIAESLVNCCDLMIEKPLSVSIDGVAKLAQTGAAAGRVVGVAYVYRAHPALAAMRHAIASGSLGKPLQLVAVCGQHFPTYRPAYRDTYYGNRALGGGAIQDALTHVLNAGEWLVGPIDRLVADAEHKRLDGVEVEDVAHILARHGDVLASYSLNQFQAPNEVTITVVCEGGTARFELDNHRWRQMRAPEQPWEDAAAPAMERDTMFINQANSFLDAIDRRSGLLCDLAAGTQTLRVNLAALKSVETKTWQDVNNSYSLSQIRQLT